MNPVYALVPTYRLSMIPSTIVGFGKAKIRSTSHELTSGKEAVACQGEACNAYDAAFEATKGYITHGASVIWDSCAALCVAYDAYEVEILGEGAQASAIDVRLSESKLIA
ncbi:MAG: hypothetical protein Q9Q40_02630 [Acidobacteriota bacterium]|nr:hypothetical protein [Acidobacteriota bacterium]